MKCKKNEKIVLDFLKKHMHIFRPSIKHLLLPKPTGGVGLARYSKTCLKQPLKNRQNKYLGYKWSLNEGQKYCRMLLEKAITGLENQFCLLFEWRLKTGFTVPSINPEPHTTGKPKTKSLAFSSTRRGTIQKVLSPGPTSEIPRFYNVLQLNRLE